MTEDEARENARKKKAVYYAALEKIEPLRKDWVDAANQLTIIQIRRKGEQTIGHHHDDGGPGESGAGEQAGTPAGR